MQTLEKRFERWEYHNQTRLRLTLEFSFKIIENAFHLPSFLLYLAYLFGKQMKEAWRILWLEPDVIGQRRDEAIQTRIQLSTHPTHLLK